MQGSQWHAAYPTLKNISRCDFFASASVSAFHICHATGLSLCSRTYGLLLSLSLLRSWRESTFSLPEAGEAVFADAAAADSGGGAVVAILTTERWNCRDRTAGWTWAGLSRKDGATRGEEREVV
jgi:hypothetical protein